MNAQLIKLPCCKDVRPENAARSFEEPASILRKREVVQALSEKSRGRILELGAGCLRNALHLQSRGFRVLVVEVPEMEQKFPEAYASFRKQGGKVLFQLPPLRPLFDIALTTFVIETLCDPAEREFLLRGLQKRLKRGGSLVMSVRGPADLVTAHSKGRRCSDGFITPNHTFARSYTRAELSSLLIAAGFGRILFLHRPETTAPELLHVIAHRV